MRLRVVEDLDVTIHYTIQYYTIQYTIIYNTTGSIVLYSVL